MARHTEEQRRAAVAAYVVNGSLQPTQSYCQIWCTRLMISGGLPADRPLINTIDELHSGDDIRELPEAP